MATAAEPDPPPHADRFAARAARVEESATAAILGEAARLRAAGRELLDFGVGEPDFPTPDHIKAAALAALDQNFTQYTPTGGIAELKHAIVRRHAEDFGSAYAPVQALVTLGGKQAIFEALSVLVDHGDEAILPAPYWVSFRDQIRYVGGVPVVIACDELNGFAFPLAAVERALTPRTKLILVNSPANPSGAVFPPDLFRALLDLCRRRGLWLLSDECYARLVYDSAPYSVGGERAALDHVIIAGSLSKSYAMTGWRIGYALAPPALINAMLNLQSHSTGNAVSFAQKAAVAALAGPQQPVADMLAAYRRRRALIVDGLNAIPGLRCQLPGGAFYAYPNLAGLLGRRFAGEALKTPAQFCRALLERTGIVSVPGEAFGTHQHLRLSFATADAVIRQGLARLAEFAANLQ
ncbi:MAG: pyridoxal phosphate-dependent aminotransferase [Terriglobales bacterium]